MNDSRINEQERLSWFEPGKSLIYLINLLKESQNIIRIATGFFTIKGWNLIRKTTKNKETRILVGLDDPGEGRARMALIQEIMRDLRTGLDRERRKSVLDLVDKIRSERFRFVDARATQHHNKLYIADNRMALQTSSNLTGKGLIEQVEGGNVITSEKEINALIREFDDYFDNAHDLTKELLEALLKWLQFATPWEIYLKTMLTLDNVQPPKTRYPKKPVSYQRDMIAQTLRHIREFEGSMLVASTGLGKTIVAIHVALHLREEELVDNIMVIGPKAVKKGWEKEMRDAGLPCEYFVRQNFDGKGTRRNRYLDQFTEIVEEMEQQRWLLIIDESHEWRNRFKKNLFNLKRTPDERIAFQRIRDAVERRNLKILLLTGSPYATDVDNINSQLYLLPHRFEPKISQLNLLTSEGYQPWSIANTDEFADLPVVSQLTTPHVATYYGQKDERGIYINFPEEKRYLPRIILHSITFPLILQSEMIEAFIGNCFGIDSRNPMFKNMFNRLVKIAWASSPQCLQRTLASVADTPDGENSYKMGDLEFFLSRLKRQEILQPILSKLKNFENENDIKLLALSTILEEKVRDERKVIIFCERRETVSYLYYTLTKLQPSLKIAVTIEKQSEDSNKLELKDTEEIGELIKKFAPIANQATGEYAESYDIFISTDAHGVGVNMQDASVVINYDIDWTPIGPVQRAGRILRFWHSPRAIEIYTFVPTLTEKYPQTDLEDDLIKIQKRWENLISRHQESRKLIDLAVLTQAETQEIDLNDMASRVTIRSGEMDIDALADFDISPYYQHTAKLQLNRDYALSLPDDLIGARTYSGGNPLLYLLLQHEQKFYSIFYDPLKKHWREPDIIELFNTISCEENTPTASVDYDEVEELSHICIDNWCSKHQISPDNIQRICTLYLKPEREDDRFQQLLVN